MFKTFVLAATLAVLSSAVSAQSIEGACLKSDRKAANRALCGCIQDVADLVLNTQDQRRAAAFFANPQQAQDIRQSDSRRDESFWDRYKAFGRYAEHYCS